MKIYSVLAILLTVASSPSFAGQGLLTDCTKEYADQIKVSRDQVEKDINIGTVAPIELERARVFDIEAQYCSKQISLKSACAQIIPIQKSLTVDEEKKYQFGTSTIAFVMGEMRKLAAIQQDCK